MTTMIAIACYSKDGDHFDSIFSVYDDEALAQTVCHRNNQYEAIHHPNDDIVYKVITLPKNRNSIF